LVAVAFGLLHGFGFTTTVSEIGLRRGDIPLALLMLNVGVEIGQLAFIGAVLAAALAALRVERNACLPASPAKPTRCTRISVSFAERCSREQRPHGARPQPGAEARS
jgi:hypothetical protein